MLHRGHYSFPFSLELPEWLPASCLATVQKSELKQAPVVAFEAQVSYKLIAQVFPVDPAELEQPRISKYRAE